MGGDKCASSNMDDRLLTRSELALRWKVSIETLKRRERAKILCPIKLQGRIIRYRITDVLRIEEEGYSTEKYL
jgi:hypothetical protein